MVKIAVIGATGLVGTTIMKILKEENLFSGAEITFFASEKNHGKIISYYGRDFRLVSLSEKVKNQKFDVVFFSAGDEVSKKWVKVFADNGAFVIDNTNAFRKEPNVPLVVPEINADKISQVTKIISNPNCSTIELAVVLDRLLQLSPITKVVVSTYQSVSGAGVVAVSDLKNGTRKAITEGIKNNVIAQIGSLDEFGVSTEENKIMFETNKILDTNFAVVATAVRVPVPYCHTESVYVEFENKIQINKISEIFDCSHICFENDRLFLPSEVAGLNQTFVYRLRKVNEKALSFVVVADNLRRGASYNAVMIYKHLLEKGFVAK